MLRRVQRRVVDPEADSSDAESSSSSDDDSNDDDWSEGRDERVSGEHGQEV